VRWKASVTGSEESEHLETEFFKWVCNEGLNVMSVGGSVIMAKTSEFVVHKHLEHSVFKTRLNCLTANKQWLFYTAVHCLMEGQ
jgi:shikimate kinase